MLTAFRRPCHNYDFTLLNVCSLRFLITISWVLWSNTEQYKTILTNPKAINSAKTRLLETLRFPRFRLVLCLFFPRYNVDADTNLVDCPRVYHMKHTVDRTVSYYSPRIGWPPLCTYLYTLVGRGNMRVKFLAQEQNFSFLSFLLEISIFQNCFSLLCSSKNSKVALDLLDIISGLRNNSYWLVKVEL